MFVTLRRQRASANIKHAATCTSIAWVAEAAY
jgi:hypothetical protein